MNIFVSGAAGFIGSNLINRLRVEQNNIFALVRNTAVESDKNIKVIEGDVLDIGSFADAMKTCDLVFHCAAFVSFHKKNYTKAYQINVEGTRNVLEAAFRGGVSKFVHLSACAVFGYTKNQDIALDESRYPMLKKNNIYAYTKALAEKEVLNYVEKGLNASIANIATVYGQGDRKLNSGASIKGLHEGKLKFIPPGGTSYVAVDDLVDGLLLLAEKGVPGERYIFCSENLLYRELLRRIAKTLNVKPPHFVLPKWSYLPFLAAGNILEYFSSVSQENLNLISSQIVKEIFRFKYFNSIKARDKLGWSPQQSFENAVRQAVEYYKENQLLK